MRSRSPTVPAISFSRYGRGYMISHLEVSRHLPERIGTCARGLPYQPAFASGPLNESTSVKAKIRTPRRTNRIGTPSRPARFGRAAPLARDDRGLALQGRCVNSREESGPGHLALIDCKRGLDEHQSESGIVDERSVRAGKAILCWPSPAIPHLWDPRRLLQPLSYPLLP